VCGLRETHQFLSGAYEAENIGDLSGRAKKMNDTYVRQIISPDNAWDQNLMTEWHLRYGGKGVMIYWHVERHATCIYSQLKTCSSSEVAAMIKGV
jgi:hypothetical protein